MSRTAVKRKNFQDDHHLVHRKNPQDGHHLLLVGGGPRSIIQVKTEIAFMLLHHTHFQELVEMGARYNIKTTVVEKHRRVGGGASFSGEQTGMANTGIEDDILIPLPDDPHGEDINSVKGMLSYKQRYEERFGQEPERYYNQLKKLNLPGAVMFRRSVGPMSSTLSGQLDHSRAYLMRQSVGEEEYEHFTEMRRLAQKKLPFYKLIVQHSSLLEEINVSANKKPTANVRGLEEDFTQWIQADQIRLNTGTTLKNPISNHAVQRLTFCQSMNVADLRRFFRQHDMLDENDKVIRGLKIICGGLSLSSLDQLSALDGVMNLFEEDDSELLGYRVSEDAKLSYQGAITFVSRTPGKACPPRHSFTCQWQQDTPVIGNTKHLHSLFLHENGEQVFQLWFDLLKAAVARAANRTPTDLDSFQPTDELLSSKFKETRWFLDCRRKAGLAELQGNMKAKERMLKESTHTLSGAWRQAALSSILGFAPERDLDGAIVEMETIAPITYKGRQTMLMHRAQLKSMTDLRAVLKSSNKKSVGNMRKLMSYVTSSPVEIHSMFHLLLESGIAQFVAASYDNITCDSSGEFLMIGGKKYDALVVSPVFERSADPAVSSLAGMVRPIHSSQPTYGAVGKFRRFLSPGGETLAVEDNGLGGAGFTLREEGAGHGSLVGAFAGDINNRASAASTAASFAMRRMALSHLKAAGVEDASGTLDEIYERQMPGEKSYLAEVGRFAGLFDEACEMGAYVKAIGRLSERDDGLFRILYDAGLTSEGRKMTMTRMERSEDTREQECAEWYNEEVQKTPQFSPPGMKEYFERFVDTTAEENVNAYKEAIDVAKSELKRRWQ